LPQNKKTRHPKKIGRTGFFISVLSRRPPKMFAGRRFVQAASEVINAMSAENALKNKLTHKTYFLPRLKACFRAHRRHCSLKL